MHYQAFTGSLASLQCGKLAPLQRDPNQAGVGAQQLNILFLLSWLPILTDGAQVTSGGVEEAHGTGQ